MSTTRPVDPSTPIQAPPHSAGRRFKGLRSPIDPDNIPSPTVVQEQDQEIWQSRPFYTLSSEQPPLATSDFVAVDQGNSSPRFMRLTSYAVPHTADLAAKCEWPFGAVLQPFAALHPEEETVPLVQCGDGGPPRCQHCQAYMNPFVEWVSAGQRWKCNLCSSTTQTHSSYFAYLDPAGRRIDYANRPELQKGTVDFAVSNEYYAVQPPVDLLEESGSQTPGRHNSADLTDLTSFLRPSSRPRYRTPASIRYVFALDAYDRRSMGIRIIRLRRLVSLGSKDRKSPSWYIRICCSSIIYQKPDLLGPTLLIVPDVDDPFLPLEENWFVDPDTSRYHIETLLDMLSARTAEQGSPFCSTGSAISSLISSMSQIGSHVLLFTAAGVNKGRGVCRQPSRGANPGTDDEKTPYQPHDAFWPNIAETCARAGIAIDIFVAPQNPVDLASIGLLAQVTGGELFFHPRFDPSRNHKPLVSELQLVFERWTCYDVAVKVRCSTGLRVCACYGGFYLADLNTPSYAKMHESTTFAIEFQHTGSLTPDSTVYFQCATLYTSPNGQRRVRCHNLAVEAKALMGEYFARADITAGLSLLSKSSAAAIGKANLVDIKRGLVERCISTLFAYRTNCSAATAPTQLIIPEALKTLPIFTLCLLKSKALKGGNVNPDVRCQHRSKLLSIPTRALISYIYPKLYALHDLEPGALMPGPDGRVRPPAAMRLSYLRMESGGLYLIDNGELNVIWVGGAVVDIILRDLFDVDDFLKINIHSPLPTLPTLLSQQTRHLIELLAYRRGRQVPLLVARQNLDAAELEFSNLLFEDENNDGMSYTDFLCEVHDHIRTGLKNGKGAWKVVM